MIIELNSLSYQINEKTLLDNLSLKIKEGDMISIIGPNGSGKSTLVKLISGELNPSKGLVLFNNKSNQEWDPIQLALNRSVLSQANHLSFSFSVFDIVMMGRYPAKSLGLNENHHEICKLILKKFDLIECINRNYTTLSGGEKQRVQLARVIAQIWSKNHFSNKLLILDEPTSYLDIKHQDFLFEFLELLNKKGLTIIMVLHDLNHAIIKSNKIIMLKNSKLIAFGDVNKIIHLDKLSQVFDVKLDLIKNKKLKKPIISFKEKEALDG